MILILMLIELTRCSILKRWFSNMMQKHYFYVLFCADETPYAGYAVDLSRREEEQNMGIGAKYIDLAKQ